jgi:hypothetical protein
MRERKSLTLEIMEMRDELANMYGAGATLADMETYMSNESMHGGGAGVVWSRYLSNRDPDRWLEEFISESSNYRY